MNKIIMNKTTTMKKIRGFSMVMVVVVITLFALIGGYMATMVTTSSLSASFTFGGMQGWFAAHSGTEWAMWQVLHSGTGCGSFPASFTIDNFDINITCSSAAVTEGPDSYTVYDLVTTTNRGSQGDSGYILRQVRTSVTDAP